MLHLLCKMDLTVEAPGQGPRWGGRKNISKVCKSLAPEGRHLGTNNPRKGSTTILSLTVPEGWEEVSRAGAGTLSPGLVLGGD